MRERADEQVARLAGMLRRNLDGGYTFRSSSLSNCRRVVRQVGRRTGMVRLDTGEASGPESSS
ncbi:MAG: hypothetical protein QGH97_11730 [Dehalococcoidia bacterium]|nr:hypothetical protein [Dehalococcoidia bacterium]